MATGVGETYSARNFIYRLTKFTDARRDERFFSMLKGENMDPELEEQSCACVECSSGDQEPITYNPAIPIETFEIIVTDECHRSIDNLRRQVAG
jgi:type I site-specific restriction endonuclease